jgi:hypothetical protein
MHRKTDAYLNLMVFVVGTSLRLSHWSKTCCRLLESEFLYNTIPTASTSSHADRAQIVRTTADRKGFQLRHEIVINHNPAAASQLLLAFTLAIDSCPPAISNSFFRSSDTGFVFFFSSCFFQAFFV